MLVATLVATVTFAAGFSVPGGYKGSELGAGIATLLNKPMYDVFVICNSVAMYSSIIAVVILLWTQIHDSHAVLHALGMVRLPLLIALATMSVAFMAGVYVTISKRIWIAIVALIVRIIALFVILILYIALFVPLAYKCRLVQLFADYILRAAISISNSVTGGAFDEYFPTAIKEEAIIPCLSLTPPNNYFYSLPPYPYPSTATPPYPYPPAATPPYPYPPAPTPPAPPLDIRPP